MIKFERFIQFVVWFTVGFSALRSILLDAIEDPNLQTIISAVSIATIIILFVTAWKKHLWKVKNKTVVLIGTLFGFLDYPNISGNWKVEIESSYSLQTESAIKRVGTAIIKQDYDKLSIKVKFLDKGKGTSSKSVSYIAVLKKSEDDCWYMIYGYTNNPKDSKLTNSHSGGQHNGFTYLDIDDDLSCMEGYYSNDENRKTRGKIKFTRK